MSIFRDPKAVLTATCLFFLVLSVAVGQNAWIAYLSIAAGSYFALLSAYDSLRAKSIDVNILMLLAAIGAVIVDRPLEAAGLLFLFSLSGTLEEYAMARTKSAIEGLMKLRPDTALVVIDGEDRETPIEAIVEGDVIRVAPHMAVPIDGVVLEGRSAIDQSAMTGEATPVSKGPGDVVIGGTQNLGGMLLTQATTRIENSTLNKIVSLVQDAQEQKASGERVGVWFGERYTWFVISMFVVSLLVRRIGLQQQMDKALYESLILLVALSPCALVISAPASALSALAYAAKRGALVRGGRFIEAAGKVRAIAIDKTGTLTMGKPVMSEICLCHSPVADGADCEGGGICWRRGHDLSPQAASVLAAAAAVEQYSDHPIADAVVNMARRHELPVLVAESHEELPGLGVTAKIDGHEVAVGKVQLFEHLGLELPEDFVEHSEQMAAEGMTVALMHRAGSFAALALRDEPRDEAGDVLKRLRAAGVVHIAMITGDNPQTANSVGAQLGVDAVHAGLLPADKEGLIAKLENEYGPTMMVGDGINDAPSLARATLGVAMGGLGSDIALSSADIVLMNDRLDRLPELVSLGRCTNAIIRANLVFAAGVIVTLTAFSLANRLILPLAVLGHEGSTVLVILNGLRLLRGAGVRTQS